MAVLKSDISLFLIDAFENSDDVINELSARARDKGFVDETFAGNVINREREYPTGLPTGVPIAIPHIHEGCLESFFAMALPVKPVPFFNMGDSNEQLMAEMVFLFGITDPGEQTAVLKKFAKTFQHTETLKDFQNSASPEEIAEKVRAVFGDFIRIG